METAVAISASAVSAIRLPHCSRSCFNIEVIRGETESRGDVEVARARTAERLLDECNQSVNIFADDLLLGF